MKAVGGRVEFQRCWRVISTARGTNTGLAVSRSLGDLEFKEPRMLVERRPDVGCCILKPEDAFVVLASDGLWDVLNDQEAVDIAQVCIRNSCSSASNTIYHAWMTHAGGLAEGRRPQRWSVAARVWRCLCKGGGHRARHGGAEEGIPRQCYSSVVTATLGCMKIASQIQEAVSFLRSMTLCRFVHCRAYVR